MPPFSTCASLCNCVEKQAFNSPRRHGNAEELPFRDPHTSRLSRGNLLPFRSPDDPITGSPDLVGVLPPVTPKTKDLARVTPRLPCTLPPKSTKRHNRDIRLRRLKSAGVCPAVLQYSKEEAKNQPQFWAADIPIFFSGSCHERAAINR